MLSAWRCLVPLSLQSPAPKAQSLAASDTHTFTTRAILQSHHDATGRRVIRAAPHDSAVAQHQPQGVVMVTLNGYGSRLNDLPELPVRLGAHVRVLLRRGSDGCDELKEEKLFTDFIRVVLLELELRP